MSVGRDEGISPIFVAKVKVLNDAIAECGMGAYQVSFIARLAVKSAFAEFAAEVDR